MNLVEMLLAADVNKVGQLKTEYIKSEKLTDIIGGDDIKIKIQEVPARRLEDITMYAFDKNGEYLSSKGFDMKLLMCIEGIVEPNLKNKDLQSHFGCNSAKDLAEKLFGSEITNIANEISKLSNLIQPEDEAEAEEKIKN